MEYSDGILRVDLGGLRLILGYYRCVRTIMQKDKFLLEGIMG